MTLTLKQLEAFAAVADLGSFRRAAERLNTSQPNISARIAQLEERLGLTLMERDAGSLRLTRKGAELLDHARTVLRQVDALIAAAGDDSLYQGVIRLGVTELIAHTWLSEYLRTLKQRFPQVTVELTVDMSETLSDALFARELDLAVQNGPFARASSGSLPVGMQPMVWVAAAGRLASATLSAADLAELSIFTHARGTQPWRQLVAHFREAGVKPRLVPASNIAACLQMTLEGLGVACLPRPMVAAGLADGRLVELDYGWRLSDLAFEARYDAASAPPYLVAAARLAQRIGGGDDPKT